MSNTVVTGNCLFFSFLFSTCCYMGLSAGVSTPAIPSPLISPGLFTTCRRGAAVVTLRGREAEEEEGSRA